MAHQMARVTGVLMGCLLRGRLNHTLARRSVIIVVRRTTVMWEMLEVTQYYVWAAHLIQAL